MNVFQELYRRLPFHKSTRHVALVLSGGGARGLAHIGAIDELQERGYEITSVAGTSMGALVGGVFAVGKLDELRRMALGMKRFRVISLIDISLGLDHVVGGKKVMQLLRDSLGDLRIEDLRIPFCCCASDLTTGKEHVFRTGPLCDAIRASISIPGIFKPEKKDGHVLVDGSVHNTLPLDRVERHRGDVLMAINASAPNLNPEGPVVLKSGYSSNYVNLASCVVELMVTTNTQMAMRLTPPVLCADIPTNLFGIFEFDKAQQIIDYGKEEMRRQLDAYETSSHH